MEHQQLNFLHAGLPRHTQTKISEKLMDSRREAVWFFFNSELRSLV
jgi:hypothetical protein